MLIRMVKAILLEVITIIIEKRDTAYNANGKVVPKNGAVPAPKPITAQTTQQNNTNNIKVIVDGETINIDQRPENINNRMMVPIRYAAVKKWDAP